MAQCFPALEIIDKLRPPPREGERALLDFLCEHLDNTYEIYFQPFLNGDRPDFILVRKDYGVLIIEVKDWLLKKYINQNGGSSEWRLNDNTIIPSPLAQVDDYKKNLYNLHIKMLFERNVIDTKNFSIVKTACYFHKETTQDAEKFCFDNQHTKIFGYDLLDEKKALLLVLRSGLKNKNALFDQELYESFCRFFRPPEHILSQGLAIEYTKRQIELSTSRAESRQKIRGVAGSGKTKILAKRAVNAYARTEKTILILTYNITLKNYIHDRISEVRADFPWSAFEITNYHNFFKTQANNYGIKIIDFSCFNNENFFDLKKSEIIKYPTILIDEIQDYKPSWIKLISDVFLEENGELVVFGDEKQNIYGNDIGKDKFPVVPTILGRWNEMKESFRISEELFRVSALFQKEYLSNKYNIDFDVVHQQGDLFEKSSIYRYLHELNISDGDLCLLIKNTIIELNIHPNDVVILGVSYDSIRFIDYFFRNEEKQKTSYMGETQEEFDDLSERFFNNKKEFNNKIEFIRRGRKVHFWGNAGTIKISTIHSFKGWEINTLFLLIRDQDTLEEFQGNGSLNELIYTALTRAKKNIIIINSTDLYHDFFNKISST